MLFHHCALRDNGVFSDIREKTDYSSHADICAVAYIIPVDHCAVTDRDALSYVASVGLCLGAAYVNYAQFLNRAFVAYPNRAFIRAYDCPRTNIASRTDCDIADYNGRMPYACLGFSGGVPVGRSPPNLPLPPSGAAPGCMPPPILPPAEAVPVCAVDAAVLLSPAYKL